MRIDEYNKVYGVQEIANSVFLADKEESITGRVMSIRAAGHKLIFFDLVGDEHKVQVMANAEFYVDGDFE